MGQKRPNRLNSVRRMAPADAAKARVTSSTASGSGRKSNQRSHPSAVLLAFPSGEETQGDALRPSDQRRASPLYPALPLPLASFVGREQEKVALTQLLRRPDVRLVSLTGPGGVGKTRLALEIANSLRQEFAKNVVFVSLAAVCDQQQLFSAIAAALGLSDSRSLVSADRLGAALQQRNTLLILDNFEQLAPAAPPLTDLLTCCPFLKLLVTSRSVLQLYPEHCFPVAPLAYVDPDELPGAHQLSSYPAVDLFIQRARAVNPDLILHDANVNAIARICVLLDGLPLAIELAAARTKLLSPQALLPRLARPLELLTGGGLDMPARQQTLRATLEWSYELLHPAEQQLFRRLAVFEDGCTLAAAEAVCAISGASGASFLDLVTSLINKSLLRSEDHGASEPRLHMLRTVSAFALECLQASGELEQAQQARAAYYRASAEEEARLHGGTQECRPAGLTSRELEVLKLVAASCSNATIAERLVVSNATVRAHLVSVYRKLGVCSRTEAMRFAIDHHLA